MPRVVTSVCVHGAGPLHVPVCVAPEQVEKLKNVNDHLKKSLEALLAPPSKK